MPIPQPARPVLAGLAVLFALAPPVWGQRPSLGPLTAEEGAPAYRLGYTPMTEAADLIAPGGWRTDIWLGYSNIFEQDSSATHRLFLDAERLISTVGVRHGAGEHWEVGGRLTLETAGGGILDPVLSWWHRALHLGNANRDRFPRGGHEQRLAKGDTVVFDFGRRTLALEDVRIYAKWRASVSEDGRKVVSLRATARIPIQENRVGTERADFGLSALSRMSLDSWHIHGIVGITTVRASPDLDPFLRNAMVHFMVAAERPLGGSVSGIVQYSITSPMLAGFDDREIDWAASNFVFGIAGRVGESWSYDVSFQEDIPPDTPAVDFTLGIRVSRSW